MHKDLQMKLVQKHPELYTELGGRGIECGNGWYVLLDMMSDELADCGVAIQYIQIKQKFTELVVYWQLSNDSYYPYLEQVHTDRAVGTAIVNKYERLALMTCELCGFFSEGEDLIAAPLPGWRRTLCSSCHETQQWVLPATEPDKFEFSGHDLARQHFKIRKYLGDQITESNMKSGT